MGLPLSSAQVFKRYLRNRSLFIEKTAGVRELAPAVTLKNFPAELAALLPGTVRYHRLVTVGVLILHVKHCQDGSTDVKVTALDATTLLVQTRCRVRENTSSTSQGRRPASTCNFMPCGSE